MRNTSKTGHSDRGDTQRPVIVCVDDEPLVLSSLKRQLRKLIPTHRVEPVASGEAALELLERLHAEQREVPLLISDQLMPGMLGDELLAQVAQRYPDIYQIMLTGQASADAVGRAINNGSLHRFLTKPWMVEDLKLGVESALNAHAQRGKIRAQEHALKRAFQRSLAFVPQAYLRLLGRDRLEDIERGDSVSTSVAVMFADIRGFTGIIESLDPKDSYTFVNAYFSATEPAVRDNGGFIDHYQGDGTMALFPNEAADGLRAATEFCRRVDDFNAQRIADGQFPIDIGIGLHCGNVIAGVSGGTHTLQCGVIGDCVNVAARCEGLTSRYNTRLVVTENLVNACTDTQDLTFRRLETVIAKGKKQPVTVYEVLNVLPEATRTRRLQTLADYRKGMEALDAGDAPTALGFFAKVATTDPNDRASNLLMEHCLNRIRGAGAPTEPSVPTLQEKSW